MTRKKAKLFAVGDRVAYGVAFLRSTGMITGEYPRLRGTVRAVETFGAEQLVTIEWDNFKMSSKYHHDGLGRVIAPNLTLVSRVGMDSALNT